MLENLNKKHLSYIKSISFLMQNIQKKLNFQDCGCVLINYLFLLGEFYQMEMIGKP